MSFGKIQALQKSEIRKRSWLQMLPARPNCFGSFSVSLRERDQPGGGHPAWLRFVPPSRWGQARACVLARAMWAEISAPLPDLARKMFCSHCLFLSRTARCRGPSGGPQDAGGQWSHWQKELGHWSSEAEPPFGPVFDRDRRQKNQSFLRSFPGYRR